MTRISLRSDIYMIRCFYHKAETLLVIFYLKSSRPLPLVTFITAACKRLWNIDDTISKYNGIARKKPCINFTVITTNTQWTTLESNKISGCNCLETEILQSNTSRFIPVSTENLFTLIARTGVMLLKGNMDLLLRIQ